MCIHKLILHEEESTERDKDRQFSNVNEIHLLHNDENSMFALVKSLCVCVWYDMCCIFDVRPLHGSFKCCLCPSPPNEPVWLCPV